MHEWYFGGKQPLCQNCMKIKVYLVWKTSGLVLFFETILSLLLLKKPKLPNNINQFQKEMCVLAQQIKQANLPVIYSKDQRDMWHSYKKIRLSTRWFYLFIFFLHFSIALLRIKEIWTVSFVPFYGTSNPNSYMKTFQHC